MIKEYYTENKQETSIQIENSKILAIKNKNITQKSVRVFDEEKKILALAPAVGDVPDDELEKKAIDMLSLNISYDYELEKETKGDFVKNNMSIKSIQELEIFTKNVMNDLKDISKDFVINGMVSSNTEKQSIKNSFDLNLSLQKTSIKCSFSLKKKGSGNIMDGFTGFYGYDITENKYKSFLKDTEFIAGACSSDIVSLENKSYKILSNKDEILRKLYSDIKGIEYEEKTSLIAGKLNEKIANESFCINECYDYENLGTYIPFDDEGIVREKELVLIENGILKNVLYDKKQAKKYGKVSTGNGFRSYNTHPSIASRKWRVLGVEKKVTDLLIDDTVIIPFISSGGDFLPNGNFTLPVQLAFVFKNGKFVGRAPQITMIGNYLDCLNKDFLALGKNDFLTELMDETLILSNILVKIN